MFYIIYIISNYIGDISEQKEDYFHSPDGAAFSGCCRLVCFL